ncbi:MAG: hypothetical protein ACHQ2F_00785 [Desulfobaccales bacterium]
MELADFIKGALLSITTGITEANKCCAEPPPFTLVGGEKGFIEFEVYVLVEEESSIKGKSDVSGGFFNVLKVAIGGELRNSSKDTAKHLIKFKVRPSERSIY